MIDRRSGRTSVAAVAVSLGCLVSLGACSADTFETAPTEGPSPTTAGTGAASDDGTVLAAVLEDWAREHPDAAGSPVAVGVARSGGPRVVVTGGSSAGEDVDPESWFRLGSLTKTYVATAILRLAERGELDLDAPAGTYVEAVPGGSAVTVRQLLSHTSGLADYTAEPEWLTAVTDDPSRAWTAREVLALIPPDDPEPGAFAYSNTNYVVLGLVLESVTGGTPREAVAAEVLRPAGLEATDLSSEGRPVVGGLADPGDGTSVSTLDGPYTAIETSAGAAGSVTGTVPDLLRFGQALLDGELLSEESWAQMTDFGAEGIYGLGLGDLTVISGGEVDGVGNYGEIPGFSALLVLEPDTGTVLAAVSADDRASAFDLGAALQRALAGEAAAGPTAAGTGAPGGDAAARTAALFSDLDPAGPGCSVAVTRSGRVVYADAWGTADLATGEPMTTDTVVDIGSATKQFTATAALVLADEGRLDLRDRLSVHLAGFPSWADRVTVADLVHHTSGIPDYVEALLAAGRTLEEAVTTDDALEVLRSADVPEAVAGHEYSNSNYLLLGEVVAAVAGADLADVLTDLVLRPAGVAAVVDPLADVPGKAVSYVRDGDAWLPVDSGWSQVGDGGVLTTPTELALWGGQYWAPTVGSATVNEAREAGAVPTGEGDDERYGAGVRYSEVPGLGRVIGHVGAWEAFVTTFDVLPDLELAIAATCASPDLPPVRPGIGRDILRLWAGEA